LRDGYAEIQKRGATLAAVAQGTPAEADAALRELALPFPILADPQRASYAAYGLPRGGWLDVVNVSVVRKAREVGRQFRVSSNVKGSMLSSSDWKQMPGTFVIDRRGRIAFSHVGADSSDTTPPEKILAALDTITRAA
jgi:peroxiredoxin